MIKRFVCCAFAALLMLASFAASAQDKVVYHISDAKAQALGALRSARNQLDVEPTTQIIFVAHAEGVDFLMEGANDRNGSPYAATVAALRNRGVRFEVCEITLKNRGLNKNQFIEEADFTPSGVVRITKLQKQGYAYLKP
jgi:intracellular sulfur oxidation DsrE/DsrF family protein